MEPQEHPADTEAAEGLEHWLRDLRTEVAADPTGWADNSAEPPAEPAPDQVRSGGGRHRAAD